MGAKFQRLSLLGFLVSSLGEWLNEIPSMAAAITGNASLALTMALSLSLFSVASASAAANDGDGECAPCNCTCKDGRFMGSFLLYLVGFACAFAAGSMTSRPRLFYCTSTKAFKDEIQKSGAATTLKGSLVHANGTVAGEKKISMGLSMMEQLVPEITHQVLTYLDFKSLCCMSMTNLAMKNAANDERAWKALYHKDFNEEQSNILPTHGWKAYYKVTKAVTEANRVFYNKFRAKSTRGMSQLWLQADYVKCVHPGGEIISGYDAVMANWRTVFSWNQNFDFQLQESRVRVMGDLAWVTSKAFVNASVEPLVSTNCYEFHNQQWYIVHHHCSPQLDFAVPDYAMFG